MAGKGVSVTISAVDQASSKIDKINKRLAAAQAQVKKLESERSKEEGKAGSQVLTKGFDGLKRGIAGVPDGLGKIQRGFGDLASRARDAFHAVGQIVTPLAAITSAASIAGLANLATGWANTTQQLGFAADRANMTIGQFKSLRDAMMLMGTSTEGAEQAITSFKDTITNTIGGHDKDAAGYFQQLGISMDDLKNKSPVELMKMVMAGMANLGDATLRTRIQTRFFSDSSAALMHVLAQTPEALDANIEKARQYAGLTDEQRKKADDLANAQKDLRLAVSGLTDTLGAELSPVLTPMLEDLAKWIVSLKDNKEFMDELRGAVRGFGDAIKGINWHEVWEAIKGIAKGVNDAVQAFGGWERAGETLGVVLMLKVLSPLTSIVATLGNLVALRLPLWLLSLLGVSGGAVATGAGVTAAAIAGYKGATKSGEEIAHEGKEHGATPAMIDQFGNAIGYYDKEGNYRTGHEDQDNKPGLIRRGLNWWYRQEGTGHGRRTGAGTRSRARCARRPGAPAPGASATARKGSPPPPMIRVPPRLRPVRRRNTAWARRGISLGTNSHAFGA